MNDKIIYILFLSLLFSICVCIFFVIKSINTDKKPEITAIGEEQTGIIEKQTEITKTENVEVETFNDHNSEESSSENSNEVYQFIMNSVGKSDIPVFNGSFAEKSKVLNTDEVLKLEKDIKIERNAVSIDKNGRYTIEEINYIWSVNEGIKEKNINLNFDYPQIYGLKSKENENNINYILQYVVLDSIFYYSNYVDGLKFFKAAKEGKEAEDGYNEFYNLNVFTDSVYSDNGKKGYIYSIYDNYLSVLYNFYISDGNRTNSVWILLTLNLENGEFVNLDNYVDKESIIKAIAEGKYEDYQGWLSSSIPLDLQKKAFSKQFEYEFYTCGKDEYNCFNSNNLFFDDKYIYVKFSFSIVPGGNVILKIKKEDVILK